jgi:curli production assembly/transport component CsgF
MNIGILNLASLRAIVLVALSLQAAGASELVYAPVNPTFGGNPNNGPMLLNVATAQNPYKAPVASALDKFSANLQNAIYSRLQSAIISGLFPSNATKPSLLTGSYTAGNFDISSAADANDPNTIVITVTDKTTGATASFTVNTGF